MNRPRELDGKVAIVTGGSSGIGAAVVHALAHEGCSVVVNYVGEDADALRVCEDARKSGVRAVPVKADISTEAGVDAVFGKCISEFGPPHYLVNNAGMNANGTRVADMPVAQWENTLRINLTGPFLCSRAFVRERRGKTPGGRIVNVSSVHEDIVVPGFADYDASKAGLLALTRTLAFEVAPLGITVNAVAPGMVLTSMNEEARRDPDVREEKVEHIPLRRAASPEEIATVVVFLCKETAGYITGESVRIDGGLSLNIGQGA